MSQTDRSKSPFSELSYSQQQEQWRMFRAQQLDFKAVAPEKTPSAAPSSNTAPAPAMRPLPPPSHHNLDRVRAQLSAAVRRAGAFQPTSME